MHTECNMMTAHMIMAANAGLEQLTYLVDVMDQLVQVTEPHKCCMQPEQHHLETKLHVCEAAAGLLLLARTVVPIKVSAHREHHIIALYGCRNWLDLPEEVCNANGSI